MKFMEQGLNTQQVIDGLQEMQPRSDWEKELIAAAVTYVGAVLEKGNFNQYWQLRFPAEESRKGICPVCGEALELDGGIDALGDDTACEGWECPGCGSYGVEYRKTVFGGHLVKELSIKGHQLLIQGRKGQDTP